MAANSCGDRWRGGANEVRVYRSAVCILWAGCILGVKRPYGTGSFPSAASVTHAPSLRQISSVNLVPSGWSRPADPPSFSSIGLTFVGKKTKRAGGNLTVRDLASTIGGSAIDRKRLDLL